jgi:hypothetical protein
LSGLELLARNFEFRVGQQRSNLNLELLEVVINSNGLSWMPIGDCRVHHRLRICGQCPLYGWMELVRWALPTRFDGVLEFGIAEKLLIG